MQLNIDTSKVVQFADKLESMSKTALPRVVKETLSKTALHVKQKTMPKSADREFVNRKKNFFIANSSVEFARMGRIKDIKSTVGFIEGKLKGDNNFAVKDLEQQEYGGKIKGRKFIPMDSARSGGNRARLVKRAIPSVKELNGKVINASRKTQSGVRIKSKKQRFIRAAFAAKKLHGNNAFVLGNVKQGRQTLSRIDEISTDIKSRKLKIKRTAVYSYKKSGTKPVTSTGFMRRASHESGLNINDIFIEEATKQLERYLK